MTTNVKSAFQGRLALPRQLRPFKKSRLPKQARVTSQEVGIGGRDIDQGYPRCTHWVYPCFAPLAPDVSVVAFRHGLPRAPRSQRWRPQVSFKLCVFLFFFTKSSTNTFFSWTIRIAWASRNRAVVPCFYPAVKYCLQPQPVGHILESSSKECVPSSRLLQAFGDLSGGLADGALSKPGKTALGPKNLQ